MKSLQVIKIGGNVIDNPESLQQFIADFACCRGLRYWVMAEEKLQLNLPKIWGSNQKCLKAEELPMVKA